MYGTNRDTGFSEAIRFKQERQDADSKSEIIGNETLIGQVATFMENLHLSYHEVVEVIPYRYLLMMAKDKQHVAYGEVWEEVDEAEFFSRMGKKNPFKDKSKVKES